MKKRSKIAYFAAGMLTMLLLFQSGVIQYVYGLVAQELRAYRGVMVFVDGSLLSTTNVNGEWVDSYVIEGTTYVPARSIGEALGRDVYWNSNSQSVYINRRNAADAEPLTEMSHISGTSNVSVQALDIDSLGRSHYNCFTSAGWTRTYNLSGRASYLTGTLYKRYDFRDYAVKSGTTVSIYGDGTLLYRERISADTTEYENKSVYVDLTGVNELTVVSEAVEDLFSVAFGDATVYY